eukprot:c18295_g2_i1 orf=185-1717(+)
MCNVVPQEVGSLLQMNGKHRRRQGFDSPIDYSFVKLGYKHLAKPLFRNLSFISVCIVIAILLLFPQWRNTIEAIFTRRAYVFAAYSSVGIVLLCLASTRSSIYLIDFACFCPPESWRIPPASFMEHLELTGRFDDKSIDFQRKILERSGLGDKTSLSNGFQYMPPRISIINERVESERTLFTAVEELLCKTGIEPRDIDVLISNCSIFNPVPSISSMIVNRFKLRSDIKSYNLAGMGCSAGAISVDMAKHILHANPNATALVVSTENTGRNWYFGNNQSMLLTNCIFRVGGSAALVSNKSTARKHAKYALITTVRTSTAAEDKSYKCVHQEEDENGLVGVHLSKDLMSCAGNALKTNITQLGPAVLPISEQLHFLVNLVARTFFVADVKPYIPNFKKAFDHFCIHTGGRAVIRELQNRLQLHPEHTEATRMTLHRFGNTSSSSMWYAMAYVEAKGRVRRGHKLWQIGLGSGFKCCSVVWRAMKDMDGGEKGPWSDSIASYPMCIPEVVTF